MGNLFSMANCTYVKETQGQRAEQSHENLSDYTYTFTESWV